MSTCAPAHEGRLGEIPEVFFVATAIKVCYGELTPEPEPHPRDNKRRRRPSSELDRSAVDEEYTRLYHEMKRKALADIKTLVREHVEKIGTVSASYEFMNVYGMCTFENPGAVRHFEGEPYCKFTRVSYPEDGSLRNAPRLVSVTGILSPIISARLNHGELELTDCRESDYYRATEELTRLDSRSKMRAPRAFKQNLGSTICGMEHRFVFAVREDLHALGCAYGQLVAIVELLHLNIVHFIYS